MLDILVDLAWWVMLIPTLIVIVGGLSGLILALVMSGRK